MAYVRSRSPLPVGSAGFRVISYASSTYAVCGISLDRKTIYAASSSTALVQSVDDGTTWTAIGTAATFGSTNIMGLVETDDGEAICVTQAGAATPGYIYKSTGWSASHTTATWALTLTTSGGYVVGGFNLHGATFGNDKVRSVTSRVGIVSEYGPQTSASGDQTTKVRRVYVTQDYGVTWSLVYDIYTAMPQGSNGLHIHSTAYDPWWDRLWVTFGDNQQNSPKIDIIYSDDRGVTWTQMDPPKEWSGLLAFQMTNVYPLEDCIVFGDDNGPGIARVARNGYRIVGTAQFSTIQFAHSGQGQVYYAANRNRNQPGAPLLLGDSSVSVRSYPGLSATWDGFNVYDVWRDPSLAIASGFYGVRTVFGPTYNGVIVANVAISGGNMILKGELMRPEIDMYDYTGQFTGDGSATVFNIPHGLSYTPTSYQAWALSSAATTSFITTVDATNVIIAFSAAPANSASVRIGARVR